MRLLASMYEHEYSFGLKETATSTEFKSLLTEVENNDAKSLELECGNYADSSGGLHSSRFSLVAKWPRQKLLTKVFNFIENNVEIPDSIKTAFLAEASEYKNHRAAQFIAGYDERDQDIRFKIGANFNNYQNFKRFAKDTMSEFGHDFLEFSNRIALGYDFHVNKNTKEFKIEPKFYFINSPSATVDEFRNVYERYFDAKTINMFQQSAAIFISTRGNSNKIHIAFKPRNMSEFLSNPEVDLAIARKLQKKYNFGGRTMWSIALLEPELRTNNINSVNAYCVYK